MITDIIAIACLLGQAAAQFPPRPEGVTVLRSKFHENVSISYKEPGICETTPGVKSYSGYVHLPPRFLDDGNGEVQDYPINTFFWFFEARKNAATAPLAIWLNGGPGGSSMMGLLEENGPCFVANDSRATYLNPWSWNNEVNMLYIDQPNQVGFSYDVPTNVSLHPAENGFGYHAVPANFTDGLPELNYTSFVGTVSSQKLLQTANTTAQAAHALWHFAQTWFFEFPHYKPSDNRISLWCESYGGHYGPGIMRFFQEQNDKIEKGTSKEKGAHPLHLDTLGIVNGWVDPLIQGEWNYHYGYNNTYDIQLWNQSTYKALLHNWTKPDGCRDQLQRCQDGLERHDARATSSNPDTTAACVYFEKNCEESPELSYNGSLRNYYDIGHQAEDPSPAPYMFGYLTEAATLSALGVPVNFSWIGWAVNDAFVGARDHLRGAGFVESIGLLLDHGVKVHMVYGDRDFSCNWMGGEAVSAAVPWRNSTRFAAAGYVPLLLASEVAKERPRFMAGMTRQVANFSFSRVFQAGHEVPAYQPAAAYDVFMRATFNRDIATGLTPVTDSLATVGLGDTRGIRSWQPPLPAPQCYVLKARSCLPDVWARVVNGTAVVKDWIVVGATGDESLLSAHEGGDGDYVEDL
ncbi:Alpha/Beta hydrolase protein [Lasiosphaeria miniovina]|uniref:Alpha/Beta hydrolase protein n=1 Tax=Lasiosphaeria miniovina TaxID=1954250 RepID=A0AA40AK62_9PEZI|nr:Alpha/Beta hydrolase protein [Lasiosphaeria miniovina]KAK0717369.1 Alpha/Beta hydrolase protein [Lasiosphaeria miniovina]